MNFKVQYYFDKTDCVLDTIYSFDYFLVFLMFKSVSSMKIYLTKLQITLVIRVTNRGIRLLLCNTRIRIIAISMNPGEAAPFPWIKL